MRDRVVAQYRIRDEARWIRRSLERTFEIAQTVVVFDDGSVDETEHCCIAATVGMELFPELASKVAGRPLWVLDTDSVESYQGERRILHYIHSPFENCVRAKQRTDELRDKSLLWSYVKAVIECETILCMDGDEILSRAAVRNLPTALEILDKVDVLEIPVLYLWDSEHQIRVDGTYRNLDDGHPRARHPRIFTIKRLSEEQLFMTRFETSGYGGNFHCGSIPLEGWGRTPTRALFPHPIVHFGYIDRALRERKFEFYNRVDPNSEAQQFYLHVIERPNKFCPGPPQFATWTDD